MLKAQWLTGIPTAWDSQVALVVKNLPTNAGWCKRHRLDPWLRKIPWSKKWQTAPVFLPGKSHGQRSLMGYSLWGGKELDVAEHLHAHVCTHTRTHTHSYTCSLFSNFIHLIAQKVNIWTLPLKDSIILLKIRLPSPKRISLTLISCLPRKPLQCFSKLVFPSPILFLWPWRTNCCPGPFRVSGCTQ